jgi:hypothetical protein
MQFIRRLLARFKIWSVNRRASRPVFSPVSFNFHMQSPSIHREVTPHGVRVFSLCGACGAMLQASATLCEECAQKRSKPARPY